MKTKDYSKMTVEELKVETLRLVGERHSTIQDFVKERPDDLDQLADVTLTADGNHVIYSPVRPYNEKYVLFYKNINNGSPKIFYNTNARITSIDCR